jgi:transcriptional regulator with XRE-family HTH domain
VSIGDNVRRYRQAFGWTQVELSRRAGVRQPVISAVETGAHYPRIDTLRRLAQGLGLPISALVDEAPSGPPIPPRTPRTDEDGEAFDKRFARTGPAEAGELREELDTEFSELQSYVKGLRASGVGDKAFILRRARTKLRRAQERLSAITFRELDLLGLSSAGQPKDRVSDYIPSAEDTEELLRLLLGEEHEAKQANA